MTKTATQTILDENIPNNQVSTREQAGRTLSYLETWYVIDRLNQVLGQGCWSYDTVGLIKVYEGEIEQSSGKAFTTSYVATVCLSGNVDGKQFRFTDVGYGDGTDKKSAGKAHELATKEAVSDGLKRCAKNLGRSMGLALYDKTQEYVARAGSNGHAPVATAPKANNVTTLAPKSVASAPSDTAETQKIFAYKKGIEDNFQELRSKGKITVEEFKAKYLDGKGLSGVDPKDYASIYKKIKADFKADLGGK